MTGTASSPVLNLGLIQGEKGETGDTGARKKQSDSKDICARVSH